MTIIRLFCAAVAVTLTALTFSTAHAASDYETKSARALSTAINEFRKMNPEPVENVADYLKSLQSSGIAEFSLPVTWGMYYTTKDPTISIPLYLKNSILFTKALTQATKKNLPYKLDMNPLGSMIFPFPLDQTPGLRFTPAPIIPPIGKLFQGENIYLLPLQSATTGDIWGDSFIAINVSHANLPEQFPATAQNIVRAMDLNLAEALRPGYSNPDTIALRDVSDVRIETGSLLGEFAHTYTFKQSLAGKGYNVRSTYTGKNGYIIGIEMISRDGTEAYMSAAYKTLAESLKLRPQINTANATKASACSSAKCAAQKRAEARKAKPVKK